MSGVAAAPISAIERALGGQHKLAAMLVAGRDIVRVGMRENVQRQAVDCRDPALRNYLLSQFSGLTEEHLLVLFLDENFRLISEEYFTSWESDQLSLKPRRLFGRALALGSRALILAHNHPSGNPSPSPKDIAATKRLAADACGLEIILLDHFVVGQCSVYSMKAAGLL